MSAPTSPNAASRPVRRLRIEDSRRTMSVAAARDHSGRLLVKFAELADRTAAEQARGTRLMADVDPGEVPADAEEYYDRQLVGLRALATDGSEIGTVIAVLHLPLQDTLEIETTAGPRLVPFVEALVPTVDLVAGSVTIADVSGLMSEEDTPDAD